MEMKKVILFMESEIDLGFVDENIQALSLYSGSEDATGIKNKHIQTIAQELEVVLKKYPHVKFGFQIVDPEQMEQQQQGMVEGSAEPVEAEVVSPE